MGHSNFHKPIKGQLNMTGVVSVCGKCGYKFSGRNEKHSRLSIKLHKKKCIPVDTKVDTGDIFEEYKNQVLNTGIATTTNFYETN